MRLLLRDRGSQSGGTSAESIFGFPARRSDLTKLGKPYEALVAAVLEAVHPGAQVIVGEWVEGPDGRRELDVLVRGKIDDREQLILVECKDWKTKVGIEQIDAIDSKRADLSATRTMIFSNSGFSSGALRKAQRVGVICASALAAGNEVVRFVVERERLAKVLSVERYSLFVWGPPEEVNRLPVDYRPDEVEYDGLPVVNWLCEISMSLLREHVNSQRILHRFVFRKLEQFMVKGRPIFLWGMQLSLDCRQYWVAQAVQENVTKGFYDHLRDAVIVPNEQGWSLMIDNTAWREVEMEGRHEEDGLAPSCISFGFTLFRPIPQDRTRSTPAIAQLIRETETRVGEANAAWDDSHSAERAPTG